MGEKWLSVRQRGEGGPRERAKEEEKTTWPSFIFFRHLSEVVLPSSNFVILLSSSHSSRAHNGGFFYKEALEQQPGGSRQMLGSVPGKKKDWRGFFPR